MDHSSRIYVAGHTGLIGSALKRSLPTPALRCLRGIARQLMFPLNLGAGEGFSIRELAEAIAKVVGYVEKLECDTSKPDGAPRKLLDSGRVLNFGWRHLRWTLLMAAFDLPVVSQ